MRAVSALLFGSLLALICSPGARADLGINLTSASQTAASGTNVVYSGTITNTGTNDVFLNDISVTFTGGDSTYLTLDRNFFFANVRGVLSAGQIYTGPIFQIIAGITPSGPYMESVTILGGADAFAASRLATANFTVQIANQAPTADSFSGFVPGNATQTLTFTYSSVSGFAYLTDVYALINGSFSGAGACAVYYDKAVNGFFLLTDAGTGVTGPLAPGSTGTLQNSQCTLNGAGSSVAGTGNTLTMVLNLTFAPSFGLAQTIFMYAADSGGLVSGWQNKGTTAVNTPPTTGSFNGFVSGTLDQTLSFTYSSANGSNYIAVAYALLNSSLSGAGGCLVYYSKGAGFYLLNDAGTAAMGPLAPGSSGTLQNSQCTLKGTGSSVSGSGNTLTLTLSLSLSASFGGAQQVYMYATDAANLTSGWQFKGSTAVNTAPMAGSFTGFVSGSLNQSLTFTYSSVNGAHYLASVYALLNSSLSGAGGCFVYYVAANGGLYLMNDAGTAAMGPLVPGSPNALENSQCTLTGTGSVVSTSGNTLSMTLNLTFSPGFGSAHQVYSYAADAGSLVSGWQNDGTTAVNTAPTADSFGGFMNGSSNQTLTFKYSSVNGAGYLSDVYVLINSGLSSAASCTLFYDKPSNGLYLLNDAGTGIVGPLTGSNLQNQKCILNVAGTMVLTSGNTLTLTANLTFKAGFTGVQQVYLYAADAGGLNSGWVNKGSITLP